jgi:hypothetical protein
MNNPEMAVFPWIDLKEPLTIGDVEFLPRAVAIERAGELGPNVDASTSYFYDHRIEGAPYLGHPLGLVSLQPTVVLLDGTITYERVDRAALVWGFATIFGNDGQFTYANSTTFQHFYQKLGGEAGVHARRMRRMHGSLLNGSLVMNALDVRPHWCGNCHDPDEDMLPLLESIIDDSGAGPIWQALDALRLATKDDDTEPAAAEHAHYARAVERLLHRPGQPRKQRDHLQRALAEELLRPMLANATPPYRILDVRDAVRDRRNEFWHPEASFAPKRTFEKQVKVHPNLIAFRAISTLITASIRAIVNRPLPDRLETYVEAVEEWTRQIQETDPRKPEDASNFRMVWSSTLFRMRVAREFERQGAPAS